MNEIEDESGSGSGITISEEVRTGDSPWMARGQGVRVVVRELPGDAPGEAALRGPPGSLVEH